MPRSVEAIKDFFSRVDVLTSRKQYISQDEEEPFDPKKEREDVLIRLSGTVEVQEALIPYLEDEIERIEETMPTLLQFHAELCAAQGKKEFARNLIKQLKEWSKGE